MSSTAVTRPSTRRMSVSALIVLSLLAALFTAFVPATPALACDPAQFCSENPAQAESGGGGGGVPVSGGTCGSGGPWTNPWVECGYASFSSAYNAPHSENPSPLPAVMKGGYFNGYNGQCKSTPLWNSDPRTGQSVPYYAIGVNWVDTAIYTTRTYVQQTKESKLTYTGQKIKLYTGTGSGGKLLWKWFTVPHPVLNIGQSYTVVVETTVTDRYISKRYVSYSCVYPPLPYSVNRVCPTSIGPGSMTGPYANGPTTASGWPVKTGTGTVDPKTTLRKWDTPIIYSPIGSTLKSSPSTFSQGNRTALSLVQGCQKMYYNVTVDNSTCHYPYTNPTAGAYGSDICGFTPGNYLKIASGQQITCRYAVYPADNYVEFQSCGTPYKCSLSECNVNAYAHWLCNDPTGANGFDNTTDFTNPCGAPPPVSCRWSNGSGAGSITDPYGAPVSNGPQVTADGKKWTVTFPTLDCPGVNVQNQWQQYVTASNSEPFRTGAAANADNQPVFGSTSPTATTNSILTRLPSSVGQNGWGGTNLYLRFNQASPSSTAKTTVGSGQVSNPVTVNAGTAVPFGVYTVVHFTVPQTVSTGIGGSTIVNVPYTFTSQMVSFTPVSGRVAG